MRKTITIDTETHVVVPMDLMRRIEDYLSTERVSAGGRLYNDVLGAMMAAAPQPEQAQHCEQKLASAGVFKGAVGLRKLTECNEFWEAQPYGTRLYFSDGIDSYLHRDVLRAAVRALDNQQSAPLPEPANVEQAQQDGTVINYGTMVSDEFLACFDSAFSFLANGHSIGQCFDMMKFARAELIKSMKSKTAPRPVPTCEFEPNKGCKTPGHCRTAGFCADAWACSSVRPAEPDGGAV